MTALKKLLVKNIFGTYNFDLLLYNFGMMLQNIVEILKQDFDSLLFNMVVSLTIVKLRQFKYFHLNYHNMAPCWQR